MNYVDKKTELQLADKVASEIQCPICMDVIVNCVTTICGHSFCEYCLSESMISKCCCPLCREPIKEINVNQCKSMDSLTELYIYIYWKSDY